MIAFLVGTIEHHTAQSVLVNVSGIGYEVFVPMRVLAACPLGSTQKIFTFHKITEDSHTLYGFLHLEDIHLFKTLIGVSGIGAKSALQMLEFSPSNVIQAIESEDLTELTKIPGLGKKTASRLVLELKGKIVHAPETQKKSQSEHHEVIEILKGLGFSPAKIDILFQNIPEDMKTQEPETIVKWALANLR